LESTALDTTDRRTDSVRGGVPASQATRRSFTPACGIRTNVVTAAADRYRSGGNALRAGGTRRCVLELT
ncbi:MAG: hypothetical protein WA290_11220, partial [Mycobacterium sp.]